MGEELQVVAEAHLTSAAAALVDASRSADPLVVGHRGRSAVVGALLGSVAFSVTARAACPVVVVHGDEARHPGPDRPAVVGVDGSAGAQAASVDAGTIVVGARGFGSASGLFLGSVSRATIHGASCPVMVVRAG